MSNIADLKELSSSFDFWGATTGFSSDRLCEILSFAVNSVEQMEAAERERNELITQLSIATERAGINFDRAKVAEAELARRDAAAGEPVAWQYRYNDGGGIGDWYTVASESECNHLPCFERRAIYTAAQPAVLPELEQDVKNIIGLLSGNEWAEHCTKSELGRKLENEITELHNTYSRAPAVVPPAVMKHMSDAANTVSECAHGDEHSCKVSRTALITAIEALGAQQQKIVEFPKPHAHLIWIQAGRGPDDYWDDVEVSRSPQDRCCDGSGRYAVYSEFEVKDMLDAAGVKWEVKK